jgi:endoglucanase
LALCASTCATAQFQRGVSMHEALNWPVFQGGTYAWPPFATPRYEIRTDTLAVLRSAGFDHIRLTVSPAILMGEVGRRGALVDVIRSRVAKLRGSGLNVVVDLHPTEQDPRFPPSTFTAKATSKEAEAYRSVLRSVAVMLAGTGDGVALEILNEPEVKSWGAGDIQDWNTTLMTYVRAVRDVAPTLPVIVTGCCSYKGGELEHLDVRELRNDPNVLFTFHFYAPHAFTHQGVRSPRTPLAMTALVDHVPFPLSPPDLDEVIRRGRSQLFNSDRPALEIGRAVVNFQRDAGRLSEFADAASILKAFSDVRNWADRNGVQPSKVYLGEFGVMRPNVNVEDRYRWLKSVRQAAEQQDFGWAYWSLEAPQYMGLLNTDTSVPPSFDQATMRALFD